MRYTLTALTLAGALLASAGAFAQTAKPAKPAKPAAAAAAAKPAAVHSVEGVVKSVDASSIVITRSNKKEMSFKLESSTQKDGTIASGSKVSIRYHMDGASMVANAVNAEAPKAPKSAKK